MSKKLGIIVKTGLALGLTLASVTSITAPASAGSDGGAIAAGVIGGMALGAIAAGAAGAAPPPPPPPVYYAPAYAPPPPRCWHEPQQVWNGYEYVVRRVRVCE
jgi:hypothetical protein